MMDRIDRINELERALNAKESKTFKTLVDVNTGAFIGKNIGGEAFGLVENSASAIDSGRDIERAVKSLKFFKKKNIVLAEATATKEVKVNLPYTKINAIKTEISALKAGFDDVSSFTRHVNNEIKAKLDLDEETTKESYLYQVCQKPIYYRFKNDIIFETSQFIDLFTKKALEIGAEIVHTSESGSIYLKLNSVELRVSDHLVPQTSERDERGGDRWDNQLIYTKGMAAGFMQAAESKTEADFKKYVASFFNARTFYTSCRGR